MTTLGSDEEFYGHNWISRPFAFHGLLEDTYNWGTSGAFYSALRHFYIGGL